MDHLRDLDSDFSAIHSIDDMYSLDGPRFFALAYRLSAYQGVIRVLWTENSNKGGTQATTSPAARQTSVQNETDVHQLALNHPDLISLGRG